MKTRHFIFTFYALLIFTAFPLSAASRPLVTNIKSEIGSNGTIVLSWTMPNFDDGVDEDSKIDEVLVFRSTHPITSFDEIKSIAPKAAINLRSSWVDKSPPKGECFYAVILVSGGKRFPLIIPSVNATVTGIKAVKKTRRHNIPPVEDDGISSRRNIPLPSAAIQKKDMGSEVQDSSIELSLQGKRIEENTLSPYIFSEDLVEPESGEEVFLFDILKTAFIKRKYTDAAASLSRLLRTNMTRSVTTRCTFYLGECYYFIGEYNKAIEQFLNARDYSLDDALSPSPPLESVPLLSGVWIDSSLLLMSLVKEGK